MKEFKKYALEKIDKTMSAVGNNFPHITENGSWVTTEFGDWTGGFWVGQLLWAYNYTKKGKYINCANNFMSKLELRLYSEKMNFDIGFLFYTSFVEAYKLTFDEKYKDVAILAAKKLITSNHSKSQLLYTKYPERLDRSSNPVGSAIVDIMMNLGLLWWAGVETEDKQFFEIAKRHAKKTAEFFVRSDGSTYHVVDFDLGTGSILHRGTIHGLSDESTWARGHAWAINGFIQAYNVTGESLFIETVNSLVKHLLSSPYKDNKFVWDLDHSSDEKTIYDNSSAAIVADGLLLLNGNKDYYNWGKEIVSYILEDLNFTDKNNGILPQCTAYYTDGIGIHEATVWGDYYLLSAIRNMEKN